MITPIEPNVAPTGRYSSAETSRILGIHRNTLRLYALEGKIKFGLRRNTGKKFFTGAEILKFWRATF